MSRIHSHNSNRGRIMFRYGVVTLIMLAVAFLIGIKLFRTTIINASKWNAKANSELQQVQVITPVRGDILASDGSVLATNVIYYTIRIDFLAEGFNDNVYRKAVPALADSLAKYIPKRDKKEWKEYLLKPLEKKATERTRSFLLADNLSLTLKDRMLADFPYVSTPNRYKSGIVVEPVYRRERPFGDMARRSIGAVGETKTSKERHGISGLEKSLDSLLYGKPGLYKRVPLTKEIGKWTDIPAVNGYTVLSTIDINLQDMLEQELNAMLDSADAEWGTAILIDVPTGDIKAMANLEYNPKRDAYIEAYNRAVVAYEPGSVVKTISMLIALEDGLINNLDEPINIGSGFVYGSRISDSHYIGTTTVGGVLEQSSNIGMTKIIIRGYDNNCQGFVDRLGSLGLFEKMNSGIAEEERVSITRTRSKRDLANISFGYSSAIPPLYTLSVYNAIANGGKYVRPRLVRGLRTEHGDSLFEPTYIRDRICSETNAKKLQQMLKSVVFGSHGTARFLQNDLVQIAGKTGTAHPWDTLTHSYNRSKKRLAFCGFFPADNPRYSMMVLTMDPKGAYRSPARSSGRVMLNMAKRMYSRGLLGDAPDMSANVSATPLGPIAIAGHVPSTDILGGSSPRILAQKEDDSGETGALSVINLSLRDALAKLEPKGYHVTFTGSGHVVRQQFDHDNRRAMLTLSSSY